MKALFGLALIAGMSIPALAQGPPIVTQPCLASTVTTGGAAVIAIQGSVAGFYIINPLSTTDQNVSPVEPLYVDPVGFAITAGYANTAALPAGGPYTGFASNNVRITVNAATSGHRFTCVRW